MSWIVFTITFSPIPPSLQPSLPILDLKKKLALVAFTFLKDMYTSPHLSLKFSPAVLAITACRMSLEACLEKEEGGDGGGGGGSTGVKFPYDAEFTDWCLYWGKVRKLGDGSGGGSRKKRGKHTGEDNATSPLSSSISVKGAGENGDRDRDDDDNDDDSGVFTDSNVKGKRRDVK